MAATVPDLVVRGILEQVWHWPDPLLTLTLCARVNWNWSLFATEILYENPFMFARPLLIRTLLQFVNDEEWTEVPFASLIRPDDKNGTHEYPRLIKRLDTIQFMNSIETYLTITGQLNTKKESNVAVKHVARVILAAMGRYTTRIDKLTVDDKWIDLDTVLVDPKVLPIFATLTRLSISRSSSMTTLLNGLDTVCTSVRTLFITQRTRHDSRHTHEDSSCSHFMLHQKALRSVFLCSLGPPLPGWGDNRDKIASLEALNSHAETLQEIEFIDMILHGDCFSWIHKCAKLTGLSITSCSVEDSFVSALRSAELPSLEFLTVTACVNEELNLWVDERFAANPKLRNRALEDDHDDDFYDELEDYYEQLTLDHVDYYDDYDDYEDFFSDNSLDLYDLTFV